MGCRTTLRMKGTAPAEACTRPIDVLRHRLEIPISTAEAASMEAAVTLLIDVVLS
jgi:hypothetical protein